MKVLKNKKILLILPVIVVFLIVLFLIPNSGAIFKEKLNTNIDLNIDNSEYRVVFNGNGNTSGTTESKTCEYTVNCKLTSNGFVKTGYTFAGWATSANGEKVYNDGEEVLNLVLTGDYPLYANWIANELIFNSQTITKTYNKTESQTVNITEAINGTGAYTYTKKSEKDLDEIDTNYISISGSTITISADTQADTYTVVITATDNNSGESKDATYTITVEKATPTVSLTPKTGMVYTGSEQVASIATVTPETGGEVTYTYYTDNACTVPYTTGLTASNIRETAWNAGQLNQIPDTNIYIFKGGTTNPPANYVKFNCSDQSDTSTCEDWRIIGIYNGQMKIIRVNSSGVPTAPTGFTSIAWNTTTPNPGWANSSLMTSLNTTYYNTLSDTAKAMIDENGKWDVGPAAYNATASAAYTSATTTGQTVGSTTHTTPWTGKVGLMSSYEYLYATGGGDSCLTTSGYDYDGGCGTAPNDWLLNTGARLWTLSPISGGANYSLYVVNVGYVGNHDVGNYYAAVPAVFLKSSVTIASGDGISPSSAYVLDESSVVNVVNAGNYYVKASVSATENYNSAESSCVAHTIAKSDTTTTLAAITNEYNGTSQSATGAISTLNSNNSTVENAEYTYTYYEGTSCDGIALASAPINVGEYRVKATLTGTDNYNSSISSCTVYTMNRNTPTVSLTPKTGMVYTGSEQVANEATVTPETGGEVTYTYYTDNACTVPYRGPICRRATSLHTATCSRTSNGCYGAGYYSGGSKNTTTITYGNLGTGETLTPGDAFDCDVNGDKTYDAATERFYYVADEGNNAVLIYYTNVKNGTTPTQNNYAYDSSSQNYHGPRTLLDQLPSTAQWSNNQIIAPGTRQITTETGTTSTTGGTIESFTYTDKAARLLTTQELVAGCSSLSSVGSYTTGQLDGCNYLMENVGQYETGLGPNGYWLESPRVSLSDRVWGVDGTSRYVSTYYANNTGYYGVRPVITVLKSNVDTTTGNNNAIQIVDAGNYSVKASVSATENYNSAESTCVAHTIAKSNTTTTLEAITNEYNGTSQSATGAISTLNSNNSTIENAEYTYTYYEGTSCDGIALASAPINAGEYRVKATLTGTNNYNSSTSSCTVYTMNLNTPIVTLAPKTAEYTGSPIYANEAVVNPDAGGSVTYTYYTDSSCLNVYGKQESELSGTLVWVDDDNEYRTRPDAVTISLYENGSIINISPSWIGTNKSNWTFTYSGLNLSNNYEVDIAPIEYYKCSTSGLTITCRLIQSAPTAYTDLSGSITWVDNDNALGLRPSVVTIRLLQDGAEIGSRTATAATGWSYTFENQPVDNGYGGTYTYEISVDGFSNYYIRTDELNITATYMGQPPHPGGDDPPTPPVPDSPTSTNPILSSSSLLPFSSNTLRTTSTQSSQSEVPVDTGTYYVKASVEAVNGKTTSAESACVAHIINQADISPVTNLNVSTSGVVSWTNSSNADSYRISIDGINWTTVPVQAGTNTTSYNYLSTITGGSGTRTVYVKAVNSDTTNYSMTNTLATTTVEVNELTMNSNNASYGTLSPTSMNVISGVTYTTSGNVLSLSDGRSVTATPTNQVGYITTFDSWSSTSGTISSDTTITATFTREEVIYNVTFDANTGTFTGSVTTNNVSYKIEEGNVTKYSHTSNVDDTGLKLDNYGNNWTNANITGTDRGDTTKAHVVTISGSDSLTVDLYYNGQSVSYDWVSVWAGNYPNYTAASNYNSTGKVTTAMGGLSTNKYGGSQSGSYTVNGNSLTSMGHSTLTIPGDTVTFGFKSNGSQYGQGYGYYAIITGTGLTLVNNSGTYKEPSKEGKVFIGWNTESDGSGTTYVDESALTSITETSLTLYAQYRNPTATFKTGQEFNQAIKRATGTTSATYSTSNSTITAFTKYNGTPTQEILNNATIVSTTDSETEIYIWFDNGTIYWYSKAGTIYFNPTSTYMFYNLTRIDTIDLSEFDLSKVTSSSSMFSNTKNMTTLITPKVNASSSISIGKTMWKSDNTTYSSITSTMTPMTTLKVPYTITFDKNGGVSSSCTSTSLTKQIYPGNPLGTIPSATFTKVGYIVDGWQTETNGGSAVTESTIPPSSITYYAKWIKDANAVFAEDIKNNETYANANCESVQCMLEYFTQFREKRVDINGN